MRKARLRQEGGRGDYDGRLSVAGRATVNGKTTTVSKDPSPPDAGVGVVGKSSPSWIKFSLEGESCLEGGETFHAREAKKVFNVS